MNISIYSKKSCPNCISAKLILDSNNIEYLEFDIEENNDARLWLLYNHPEARQMPQIFIDDQRVGGLLGLQAALAKK